MEIREYVDILARRKIVVIVTLLVAVIAAGVVSSVLPSLYTATVTVRVAQASAATVEYLDSNYARRLLNTYVEMVRSRPLMEEVINRLDLSMSASSLSAQVSVESVADTELLRISVHDTNPVRATAVANTLGALVVEQGQLLYAGGTRSAREILEEQIMELEAGLQQQSAALDVLLQDPTTPQQTIDATLTRRRLEEETYASLLRQYEEARLAEASRANSVSVAEPAVLPDAPSSPRTKLNIALGAFVGLVGGVALGFLLESLQTVVDRPQAAEQAAEVVYWARFPGQAGQGGLDGA